MCRPEKPRRTAGKEMKREIHRSSTLATCHSAAVLGAALLLVSGVASRAAAPGAQSAPEGLEAAGPLAWWSLNEGTGNVAHDVTGHGFEGTIHGPASWVDGPSRKRVKLEIGPASKPIQGGCGCRELVISCPGRAPCE